MKILQKTFLLISSILWFPSADIHASDSFVMGQVTDPDGRPIAYVNVYSPDQDWGTTTDRDGRFMLKFMADETVLVLWHSAFEPEEIFVEGGDKEPLGIVLEPKIYHFDPVVVEGNLYARESLRLPVSHRVVPINDFPNWGNSVVEALDRRGLWVKDYGGAAGLKTVGSPTGYGSHILVMLESVPVNSPQNGGVDFSSFPAELFRQGEFYWGHGSSLYGSNAVGGTLNLMIDRGSSSYLRIKRGSFGEKGVSGKVAIKSRSVRGMVYGSRYENLGDFRTNNDFVQSSYGGQLAVRLGPMWSASYFSLRGEADRGISGSIHYPSPRAGKTNKDWIHLASLRGASFLGRTVVDLGVTSSREHYMNPDWSVDARHNVSTQHVRATHRFPQLKLFQPTLILELAHNHVDSDNTGDHRKTLAAAGLLTEVRPGPNLQFWPSVRTESDWNEGSLVTTFSLALSWQIDSGLFKSMLANIGTSYRNPTLNDLYWYPGGNPDLKPERGTSADLGLELLPFASELFQFGVRGYHFYTESLIQWVPDETGFYRPRNLGRTQSDGVSLTAQMVPKNLPFHLTFTTEQNRSQVLSEGEDRGKRLIYVPAVSHWMEVMYGTRFVDLNFNYRFLGRRRDSYYGNSVLPSYDRVDLSLTFHMPEILGVWPSVDFGVRNLQDRKQESVYGYPEPGRALFTRVSIARDSY